MTLTDEDMVEITRVLDRRRVAYERMCRAIGVAVVVVPTTAVVLVIGIVAGWW